MADGFGGVVQAAATGGITAAEELAKALAGLAGVGVGAGLTVGAASATKLITASADAARVGSIIARANGSLGGSWNTVKTVAEEINRKIEHLMQNYTEELRKFIERTQANENAIANAASKANDIAQSILSRLAAK